MNLKLEVQNIENMMFDLCYSRNFSDVGLGRVLASILSEDSQSIHSISYSISSA
jgi:hypothetical protein